MSYFNYQKDMLFCEGVNLAEVAQTVPTPFYLYSATGLVQNFEKYETALAGVPHTICFAMKSNSNRALLKLLAARGCGADVVSGGELYLALKAGFDPKKIVFAGVGKRDDELKDAIEAGVAAINVESPQELEVVQQIAQALGKPANVALRINPDIDVHGHPFISTGKSFNKFGIDWEAAPAIYENALKNMPMVKLMGIHNHIGSMIFNMEYFQAAAQRLQGLVDKLRKIGCPIMHVDIGGGLGVNYQTPLNMVVDGREVPEVPTPEPQELIRTILPILKPLNCEIFFEPGRSIVANTGILVTKVLYIKETRGKRFICVDSGMHHLIRPALYGAYHEVVALKQRRDAFSKADVVGPICESTDFLAQDRLLPQVTRGDFLGVMTAGAYGYSLATSYNAQPLPAEVLVSGDKFEVVRRRQNYDDFYHLMA